MYISKRSRVVIVLLLAVLVVGCSVLRATRQLPGEVAFEDMEYVRPEVERLEQLAADCLSGAEGGSAEQVAQRFELFYEEFSKFYTNYLLSYVHYSIDTTDPYWEEEHDRCASLVPRAEAAWDDVMYGLAGSPLRPKLEEQPLFGAGFFDAYKGENLWTDRYTALMEQQTKLESEYYDLCDQHSGEDYYGGLSRRVAEILVELVKVRQQLGREAGYGSYPEYAYEQLYQRDYDPRQAQALLEDIRKELVPLYRQISAAGTWKGLVTESDTADTFAYVSAMASKMEGPIAEAFDSMDRLGLYHIAPGEHKLGSSFEVFLMDYYEPFIFVDPTGTTMDRLTFAHEFGHFCSDYVRYGASVSVDVDEVYSQGMEYLSLTYAPQGSHMTTLKLTDSLCVYVEQAAYASFEQQLYTLPEQELTVEAVEELFRQTATAYGFDAFGFDCRSYVTVSHFFTSPMYVISYVVSNDVALQLYQLEQDRSGAGLERYEQCLSTPEQTLLAMTEQADLDSPFQKGRCTKVRQTLEKALPQNTTG